MGGSRAAFSQNKAADSCRSNLAGTELSEMWADASGRNPEEFLEQFIQDFFAETLVRDGQPDTLAEDVSERRASSDPLPIGVNDVLLHIKAICRRRRLTREEAALLTVEDWNRMGEDGAAVLRLLQGLRLTNASFNRWYPTAHLPKRPDIWPVLSTNGPRSAEPARRVASDRTGEQGRPTTRHLVVAEFQHRLAAGAVLNTLRAEAQALSAWLRTEHPLFAQMTPKTIENRIREAYNAQKATK